MTVVYIVIGVVVLLVIVGIAMFNSLVRARNRVQESWSGIDVQLKRRHDLVPNLVEVVKGYAQHEAGTLIATTNARAEAVAATGVSGSEAAENALSQALGQLMAVAESYPQLKASQNFIALQNALSEVESEIAASRSIYNSNVQFFNTRVQSFPSSIVAGIGKFEAAKFFELQLESERAVPQTTFA